MEKEKRDKTLEALIKRKIDIDNCNFSYFFNKIENLKTLDKKTGEEKDPATDNYKKNCYRSILNYKKTKINLSHDDGILIEQLRKEANRKGEVYDNFRKDNVAKDNQITLEEVIDIWNKLETKIRPGDVNFCIFSLYVLKTAERNQNYANLHLANAEIAKTIPEEKYIIPPSIYENNPINPAFDAKNSDLIKKRQNNFKHKKFDVDDDKNYYIPKSLTGKDAYFIMNVYKTSNHFGKSFFFVNDKLSKILDEYILIHNIQSGENIFDKTEGAITEVLCRIFKSQYGKRVSTQQLRIAHTSWSAKHITSYREKEIDARNMSHSVQQHELYRKNLYGPQNNTNILKSDDFVENTNEQFLSAEEFTPEDTKKDGETIHIIKSSTNEEETNNNFIEVKKKGKNQAKKNYKKKGKNQAKKNYKKKGKKNN